MATGPLSEQDLEEFLHELFHCYDEEVCDLVPELEIHHAYTFEERGLLTMNKGIVLKFKNGAEYQITINQSENADLDDDDEEDDDGE